MSVTRSDLSKLIDQISQIESVKAIVYDDIMDSVLTFMVTSDYKKIWQLRRYIHLNFQDHACIVGAGSRDATQTKTLAGLDNLLRFGRQPNGDKDNPLGENFQYSVLFSVYHKEHFSQMTDTQLLGEFEEYNTNSKTYLDFLSFIHKTRKFDINPQYTNVKHHDCADWGQQDWDDSQFIKRIESLTSTSKIKSVKSGDSIFIDGNISRYANQNQVIESLKKLGFDVRNDVEEAGVSHPKICLRGASPRKYDDLEFEIVLQGSELQNFLDRVFKALMNI
jgi:hypothetical protein